MNFGKTILELRKRKNATQEEMAAELGVTAAAVSKWENDYTLPDILMLCALADYFGVTTDELLGRNPRLKSAIIAVSSPELGQSIMELIKRHGFITKHICTDYAQALEMVKEDPSITHLFSSFDEPMREEDRSEPPDKLCNIEVHAPTKDQVLDGFEIYLKSMAEYDAIARSSHKK